MREVEHKGKVQELIPYERVVKVVDLYGENTLTDDLGTLHQKYEATCVYGSITTDRFDCFDRVRGVAISPNVPAEIQSAIPNRNVEGRLGETMLKNIGLRFRGSRRHEVLQSAIDQANEVKEYIQDPESGAYLVHGWSLELTEGKELPSSETMEALTDTCVGLFGKARSNRYYYPFYTHIYRENRGKATLHLSPADIVLELLRTDENPDRLWHSVLQEPAAQLHELTLRHRVIVQEENQARERAKLTGINEGLDLEQIGDAKRAIRTEAKAATIDLLHRAYAYREREELMRLVDDFHNVTMEPTIVTTDRELDHPLAYNLGVFKDILRASFLSLPLQSTGEAKAAHNAVSYVAEIPALYEDGSQTKQFYEGLTQQFGDQLQLPEWEEVELRFMP